MVKTSRDWTSFVIQFVPAILGSGVLITTFSSYYTDLANQPIVKFTLFPDANNFSKLSANIENSGGGPATNFTGQIVTPGNYTIDEYVGRSLEKSEITTRGSNVLMISIPRLVQGEGSIVNVSLKMNNAHEYAEDYIASAVFDQGSVKGNIYKELGPIGSLTVWASTPLNFAILGILITAIAITIRYIFLYVRKRWRSRIFRRNAAHISEELKGIISKYKMDLKDDNIVRSNQSTNDKMMVSGESINQAATALIDLEIARSRYNDMLSWASQIVPDIGKDRIEAKTNDDYFRKILQSETSDFSDDYPLVRSYFTRLEKGFIKILEDKKDAFDRAKILSGLTMRLDSFKDKIEKDALARSSTSGTPP